MRGHLLIGPRSLLMVVVIGGACTSTPSPSIDVVRPLGTPLEAIVVSAIEGATSRLSVDAVTADGSKRHLATLTLPSPDGHVRRVAVSEHRFLAVMSGPEAAEDGHTSSLVVFAIDGAAVVVPPTRVIDYSVRWGPAGQLTLAVSDESAISIIDVKSGATKTLSIANGADGPGPWLADGSGFLVTRFDEGGAGAADESGAYHQTEAGRLGLDGSFTLGTGANYQPTGVERSMGADGKRLSGGHGDFFDDSGNFAGAVSFLTVGGTDWYRSDSRRGDPEIGAYVWDREGTGIWLLLRSGEMSQVVHIGGPDALDIVATIPLAAGPRSGETTLSVVGLSHDESAVLIDETVGEFLDGQSKVHWVDVVGGSVTTHPGRFAGWADVP